MLLFLEQKVLFCLVFKPITMQRVSALIQDKTDAVFMN